MNRNRIKIIALAALVLLGLPLLYTWITLHWAYSEGSRAGYVQKFSHRGWVCKTWEGELLLSAAPGMIPEKFEFTVADEQIAKMVQTTLGKRVVLKYEQHKGVPGSCFGDTEYFVTDVATTP